jgi:hypothetical protein
VCRGAVGLLGGGIQHFEQFPERYAAMTPIGLLMSYAAFVAKDAEGRWRNIVSLFGAGVLIVAAVTWFGMNAIADSMESTGQDHSHGTEETPADEAPAKEAPAQQDQAPTWEQNTPAEPEHGSHAH